MPKTATPVPDHIFIVFLSFTSFAQEADDILGLWINEDRIFGFEVYKSQGKYYSKIAWLAEPTENGKPKVDKNNPDASKRNNPLLGTRIFSELKFDKDEWNGGRIYNAKDGKTFDVYLELEDKDELKVIGFKGSRWLSKINVWYRIDKEKGFPETKG